MAKSLIETHNFSALKNVLSATVSARGILLATSSPGMGKTSTARNIAANDRHAVLLEITHATRSYGGFLTLAVNKAGIWVEHASHNYTKAERLSAFLEGNPFHYLIIDEAQLLDLDALRFVVAFNDHCQTPIILLGNNDLLRRTRAHGAAFDQIADRITARLELPGPSTKDVESFCVEFNVAREAYSHMIAWGTKSTIRDIAGLLDGARLLVERGPIKADDIANAIQLRHGPDAARKFMLRDFAA